MDSCDSSGQHNMGGYTECSVFLMRRSVSDITSLRVQGSLPNSI